MTFFFGFLNELFLNKYNKLFLSNLILSILTLNLVSKESFFLIILLVIFGTIWYILLNRFWIYLYNNLPIRENIYFLYKEINFLFDLKFNLILKKDFSKRYLFLIFTTQYKIYNLINICNQQLMLIKHSSLKQNLILLNYYNLALSLYEIISLVFILDFKKIKKKLKKFRIEIYLSNNSLLLFKIMNIIADSILNVSKFDFQNIKKFYFIKFINEDYVKNNTCSFYLNKINNFYLFLKQKNIVKRKYIYFLNQINSYKNIDFLFSLKKFISFNSYNLFISLKYIFMFFLGLFFVDKLYLVSPYWVLIVIIFVNQDSIKLTLVRIKERILSTLLSFFIFIFLFKFCLINNLIVFIVFFLTLFGYLFSAKCVLLSMISFNLATFFSMFFFAIDIKKTIVIRLINTFIGCFVSLISIFFRFFSYKIKILRKNLFLILENYKFILEFVLLKRKMIKNVILKLNQLNQLNNEIMSLFFQLKEKIFLKKINLSIVKLWLINSQCILNHINTIFYIMRYEKNIYISKNIKLRYYKICKNLLKISFIRLYYNKKIRFSKKKILNNLKFLKKKQGSKFISIKHHVNEIINYIWNIKDISHLIWGN